MFIRLVLIWIALTSMVPQVLSQSLSDYNSSLNPNSSLKQSQDSIRTWIELCIKHYENSPDSARVLGEKAIRLSKELQLDSLLARAYLVTSVAHSTLGEFDVSAKYCFEALTIGELNLDTLIQIDANNNLGIDFYYRGEFNEAKTHFEKVRRLSFEIGDSARLGHALNNLGLIIGSLGDTQAEIPYYKESKAIFEKLREGEGEVNAIMNLGTAYHTLNRDDEAIEAFTRAVTMYDSLKSSVGKSQALMNLSEAHMKAGRTESAMQYALEARDLALLHNLKTEEAYAYTLLKRVFRLKEDYKRAYEYLEKHQEISGEIFNQEKTSQINELKARYEAEKREQQIKLLEVNNRLIRAELLQERREQTYLVALVLLILIFGAVAVYQNRQKLKLKNTLLAKEVDELRWKINAMVEGIPENVNVRIDQINDQLKSPLTEREFNILLLALSDKSNKEIAENVFVSINTVKYHLKKIYEKLGVSSRGEAVQFVIRSS